MMFHQLPTGRSFWAGGSILHPLTGALIYSFLAPVHVYAQDAPSSHVEELLETLRSGSLLSQEKAAEELAQRVALDPKLEALLIAKRDRGNDPEFAARIEQVLEEVDFHRAKRVELVESARIVSRAGGTPKILAISPDGNRIASCGYDGRIVISRTADLREIGVVGSSEEFVSLLAFRPDGEALASVEGDTLLIRELTTGKISLRRNLPGAGGPLSPPNILSICFSHDGSKVFLGTGEGLQVWDLAAGTHDRTLNVGKVNALGLSPDGATLIAQREDLSLVSLRIADGEILYSLGGENSDFFYPTPSAVAIRPNGKEIAQVRIRDTPKAKMIEEVVVWDLEKGLDVRWTSALEEALGIVGGPGAHFAVYSEDEIRVFRWEGLEKVLSIRSGGRPVLGGDSLFVGREGQLHKIDLRSGEVLCRARPHRGGFDVAALHPNGNSVVTVDGEGMIRIWDAMSGEETGAFDSGSTEVREIAISPDGARLVTANARGSLSIYDLKERALLRILSGREKGLGFTSGGKVLAGYRSNGTYTIGTSDDLLLPLPFDDKEDPGFSVLFSQDGRYALRSSDHQFDFWDLPSGKELWVMKEGRGTPFGISPDGKRVYGYCQDRQELYFVDVGAKSITRAVSLGDSVPYKGTLDPTGCYLALILPPEGLVLVHAATLRKILRQPDLEGHDVQFSPDGKRLLLNRYDTLSIFDLKPSE